MPRTKKEKLYFSQRLMEALSGIPHHYLTAVCAPSGAGKSTAVRKFLSLPEMQPMRVLWYTCFGEAPDKGWGRMCDLFAELDKKTATRMKSLGFPTRQTLSLLADILQRVHCQQETVLVIDNAHLFNSDIPYELICALALHRNEKLHIVLITQNPLDAPSTVISAPGVLFIGTAPFFFTESEIAAYFKLNGIALSWADVQQVMENTLGWVAALRLQMAGYQQTGMIQREIGIEQLVDMVVWRPLTKEERQFLIAFSQVENATPKQICILLDCDELPANAKKLLERDTFIYYDLSNNRYIMHQILRDFAQKRFDELPESERKLLDTRAGRACLDAGAYFPALQYMLKAGNYEELLRGSLKNNEMADYTTGEVVSCLAAVLEQCPGELLERNPGLLIHMALEFMVRGEHALYLETCAIIDRALKHDWPADEKKQRMYRGAYIYIRSFDSFNHIAEMNAAYREALAVLDGPMEGIDASRHWSFGVPSILALYWGEDSSLPSQLELMARFMPDYTTLTGGHGLGAAELMQAEADLNAGNLDRAETLCNKALFLDGSRTGNSRSGVCFGIQLTLGRIAVLRGNTKAYLAAREQIYHHALEGTGKARLMMASQCTAYLDLELGCPDEIPDWLMDEADIRGYMYTHSICYGMMLYGKYLLQKREYNKLGGFSEPLLETAKQQCSKLLSIYYLIFLACASQATGGWAAAAGYLRQALEIAIPDNIFLPFAEHIDSLGALLNQMQPDASHVQGLAQVIDLAANYRTGAAKINKVLLAAKAGLTKREHEIAVLVKSGLSNKEIAEELSISPETVKATIKNVFAKYGVHSRWELRRLAKEGLDLITQNG